MIIDGEEIKVTCRDCGHRFTRIIGYGPVCPTSWLRRKILKENPSRCPQCGSLNVRHQPFLLSALTDLFKG